MPEAAVAAPNPSTVDPGLQGGKTLEQETYSVEDAMEEGAALAMEEVQDRLDDAGLEMDPETGEIIGGEAAFDPRARRRTRRRTKGKRKGTRRRSIRMARHPALVFDPRSRMRNVARRAKDPLTKAIKGITPYAGVAGAAAGFYGTYSKHVGTGSWIETLKSDARNWTPQIAMDKLTADAGTILGAVVGGAILKKLPIGKAIVRNALGDLLIGGGMGVAVADAIDPPTPGQTQTQTQSFPMNQTQVQRTPIMNGVPTYGGL